MRSLEVVKTLRQASLLQGWDVPWYMDVHGIWIILDYGHPQNGNLVYKSLFMDWWWLNMIDVHSPNMGITVYTPSFGHDTTWHKKIGTCKGLPYFDIFWWDQHPSNPSYVRIHQNTSGLTRSPMGPQKDPQRNDLVDPTQNQGGLGRYLGLVGCNSSGISGISGMYLGLVGLTRLSSFFFLSLSLSLDFSG